MSKYRIYDIAKELNTENKTILDILHKHNIEAKSHSSTIDDTAKQVVIKALQPKPKQPVQQSRPVSQQDRQPRQAAGDGQR
ncbi:MAG: translation initiation factor IF-2 N-terminal domain-containing protein, partial [Anaerovibrio sp.]|nr:translation initiation factor IF-2 N-terminal domain-containing protein [Anaerovibrio sp.]